MELPAFQLVDQNGSDHHFPDNQATFVCFVKEDCPTCNLVLPLIQKVHDSSGTRVLVPGQTQEGNEILVKNHELTAPLLDDSILKVSFAYDLETVPHCFLADSNGEKLDELIGFERQEWRTFFEKHFPSTEIDWDQLPEWRPGCGSLTQDPIIQDRLRAESENSPLRARRLEIASQDDIHEFMFDQGFTDGLPVVPPTPERVIRMLSGTNREPQELVATIPPNLAPATVEKIAVNAVLAGCKPEYLPVVISTIEAICNDEFNCHGVFATTMGATPVMVLNGPIR
ncbi:MAG: TlpA family protein disulfide reductase, partial [Gammaproteobacteria bacterium]|nr:TlpA family protein disulfide reductase [Gammaproteobacteria bacterium]